MGRARIDRVETYPFGLPLSLAERATSIRVGAKLRLAVEQYRRTAKKRPGETERSRRQRVLSFRDDQTFAQFLGLLSKRIDGIFRATIRRSSGEPEEVSAGYGIGYFHLVWDCAGGLTRNIVGGSAQLSHAIHDVLGSRVLTDAEVDSVTYNSDDVTVRFRTADARHELRSRYAIMATTADVTHRVVAGLPGQTSRSLQQINYGPYVVGSFLTKETGPMPYDHVYAIATPQLSFNMMFNTANLTRSGVREPGGTLMVYSGGQLARDLDDADDAHITDLYTSDLLKLFPAALRSSPRAAPLPRRSRAPWHVDRGFARNRERALSPDLSRTVVAMSAR